MERHESRRHLRPIRKTEKWEEQQRVDSLAKVTGAAQFLDDMPSPPGCLYAAPIRARGNHTRIDAVHVDDALKMEGVVEALTKDRLHGADPTVPIGEYLGSAPGPAGDQCLLTTDKGRYDGDPVGLIAATDARTARAAARAVGIDATVLPSLLSYEDAVAADAPLIHEQLPDNVALEDELSWGDVDEGFAQADVVYEGTYFGGNTYHRPLEASTGALCTWHGDELEIWTSTHKPFLIPKQVEDVLGIPRTNVRVRIPYVGGGFGSKQITPLVIGAAALARATQRPVRLALNDADSFRSTSRHAIRYTGRVGARRSGELTALDVRLDVDTGAYFTGAALVTHNACISAWGCYRLPNYRVRAKAVYTNKVPSASFRATGKNQTTFGVERLIDDLATELSVSPIRLREQNALARGEFPAERWLVRGEEYVADVPPMDTDYRELIRLAVEGIGWDADADQPAADQPAAGEDEDADVVRGRGIGLSLRHGAQSGGRAYAMVEFHNDGKLEVHHNAPDLGTGVYTVLSVVAAQTLDIPQTDVVVGHPDTRNNITFGGTSAQRTTVQMGNAVRGACEKMKLELTDMAAQALGGSQDEWSYVDGRVVRGEVALTPAALLAKFAGNVRPKAIGSYSYAPSEDKAFGGLDHWAPGAAAVEVEISKVTGEVRLLRCAAVADAGKALHEQSSRRQIEGGFFQGVSMALFEELIYDEDAGLVNADGWGYRIARMDDFPQALRTILVENGDGPGPYGSKGLSQTSLPCAAPAIGNAIKDAIGLGGDRTPFTPTRVLELLARADGRKASR